MSLKQSQWAWQQSLKSGPKLVLLALADYANDQGNCYPTLKQLQKKCGLARSTLIAHLKFLQQGNLISVESQHDKRGYRRNNLYQLKSNLGPDSGLPGVQNLDGNIINSHIDSQYSAPKSGPRKCKQNYFNNKSAFEGAI